MPRDRMLFVDNIRLVMIILVVCHHAVISYCDIGAWYYKAPLTPGPVTNFLFFLFVSFNQSFFMGTLFALAGYFAANTLERRGSAAFVRGRLLRLGVPTLFYMIVLDPLTFYLAHAREFHSLGDFTAIYGYFLSTAGILAGTGPMWFALALLLFCLVYAAWHALRLAAPATGGPRPLTAQLLVWLIVCSTAGTFALRLAYPIGKTISNLQLGNFAQYSILFIFGILAQTNDWLRTLDARLGRRCLLAVLVGQLAWTGWWLLLGLDEMAASYQGGPHWQSLFPSLWQSLNSICMTVGLIALCRERWNRQGGLVARMSESAFAVYVFHPPILVALAQLLGPVPLGALPKAALLSALAVPLCFVAAYGVQRVPLLRDMVPQ
ncbi:MAG TPA: acyltransferase family protein [Solidesulfovibrio sp.]|nr:hypothetical protein [Desulfovibrio sp.]HML61139.1 acyltransferase family protein [Solidesulfovibrio sp.]